jgi:hypothetical protein
MRVSAAGYAFGQPALRLEKSLIVAHQQIADIARHREAIAAMRREPLKTSRSMMMAGVNFGSNHLKRYP